MKSNLKSNPKRVQARVSTATDVIDRVLDKGIVIDCRVNRVSLGGLDLPMTIDARYVAASLDTYLEHAEALKEAGFLEGSEWYHELSIR